jgi:N-hydroxyarylamine O-acetyltransferase
MKEQFERYLRLLGVAGRPSGMSGLRDLVRRHLAAVPFENVSKLLLYHRERQGRPTTFAEYLDRIEFRDLGGTCYTNNPFFAELLRELGYEADLLGADMSRPNVHTCIRVRTGAAAYLVDVGFAAPFREPMPLDGLPIELAEGGNRYRLEADGGGVFRMDMYSGTDRVVGYTAHEPPREREFFAPVVAGSYALTSMFLQMLRISRAYDGYSLDLIDRKLYRHEDGRTTVRPLGSMAELMAAVRGDLAMPRCPIEAAAAILEELTGKPLF